VTCAPARRSQAAGEASPKGWRPSSYVEMRTTFNRTPIQDTNYGTRTP
jgi:hypothetical protein